MPYFNEKQLEESIIALLQEQGYEHVKGEAIERDLDEVVLRDDLRTYLRNRYSSDGITDTEVEAAIRVIVQKQGLSLYEENRHTMSLLMDGFSLKREDASKQNLYIYPIAYDEKNLRHNIFKVVNQFDIVEGEHRIPDAIVFVNGLPVVVFEFKNALKQNTTIEDAYKQLTIRYRRDIPSLFKYTAFIKATDTTLFDVIRDLADSAVAVDLQSSAPIPQALLELERYDYYLIYRPFYGYIKFRGRYFMLTEQEISAAYFKKTNKNKRYWKPRKYSNGPFHPDIAYFRHNGKWRLLWM